MKQVAKLFIRPPRAFYSESEDLGPQFFEVRPSYSKSKFCSASITIKREDFLLENERGIPLRASLFHAQLSSDTYLSTEKTSPRKVRLSNSMPELASAPAISVPALSISVGGLPSTSMTQEDVIELLQSQTEIEKEVVLYLHGSAGSRIDSIHDALDVCVAHGMALMTLDFEGCGLSPGAYVSLGIREKDTVVSAVEFLKEAGFSKVALWGRSMGAVAAILAVSEGLCAVDAVIADSPYCCLEEVVVNVVKLSKAKILSGVAIAALPLVRAAVIDQVPELDILGVDLRKRAKDFKVPILLVHGNQDDFVPKEQSLKLFETLGTPVDEKRHMCINGSHNTARGSEFYDAACSFLASQFIDKGSSDVSSISMIPESLKTKSEVFVCKNFEVIKSGISESSPCSGSPSGSPSLDVRKRRKTSDSKEDGSDEAALALDENPASEGTSDRKQGELVMRPRFKLLSIAADRIIIAEAFTGTILEQWGFAEVEHITAFPESNLVLVRTRSYAGDRWFWHPTTSEIETKYKKSLEAFVAERTKATTPETVLNNLPGAITEILISHLKIGRTPYPIEIAESLETSIVDLVGDKIPKEEIIAAVRKAIADTFPKILGKEADFTLTRPKEPKKKVLKHRMTESKCVIC